ncbi:hypothetical protein Q1695_004663 [Nippostrongylus brasiliensis]|nr:hypothetical protein Q1695_004663 [Nippostrongylus brasiliensis]
MGKARSAARQKVKTPVIVELESDSNGADLNNSKSKGSNGSDPWASIEKGEAVSAREVFYKKPEPKEPRVKHYEKFKNKKQRISDGYQAKRVEVHSGALKPIKRRNHIDEAENVASPASKMPTKKAKLNEDGDSVNVFAGVIESKGTGESTKKKGIKRPFSESAKVNKENEENLEGLESDDSYDSEEDEEFDEEDVQDGIDESDGSDSEREDSKGLDQCVVDGDDDESEDLGEEELDDEEISNMEDESDDEGHESYDSEGYDSEDEANLGEDREAMVLQYKDADAILTLPDFDNFPFTDEDSSVTATRAFAWMVAPCDVQSFFKDFFQTNALIAKRSTPNYYNNLFSTQRLVEVLEKNHLEYGTNINIAEYKDGVRITPNGVGRVYPHHLTQHLSVGRSVQFVNPQTFDDRVWYFCEVLQEMFGCFVGANTYLTPPGSAGFAPHWDEIDAFLLQLEGKKYWKVYAPDSRENELPRESSGNFTDEDMEGRKPTFEGWIEAGDLLYIPRGFIHQASTADDVHSLHITISSGRLWTFADLLEKVVPEAVSAMARNSWKMRKSLPVGMLDMNGVAEIDYRLEEHFHDEWKRVVDRHMTTLRNSMREICDGGIDHMARIFMRTALPPRLTNEEKARSVVGSGTNILSGEDVEFRPSTKVKLIRRHAQRLLFENEDSCYISHRMANSRLYEGLPEQTFEFPSDFITGFNALCNSYPEWMSLSEMPDEMNGAEVQAMCHLLFYHGLIMIQQLPDRIKRKGKKTK